MKRWILLFLCLLLVMAAGCGKEAEETTEAAAPILSQELTALTYQNGTNALRLRLAEGQWQWADDPTFPLDQEKAGAIVAQLAALAELAPVEVSQELSAYGLDKDTHTLTLEYGGEVSTIYFGVKGEGDTRYALADEEVFLVPEALITALGVNIYDMAVLPALPTVTAESVMSVTLIWGEGNRVHYIWDGQQWNTGSQTGAADLSGVMDVMGRWALSACVDYRPSEGAAAICGLEAPELTLLVRYKNTVGTTVDYTVTVGSPTLDGEGHYVTAGEDTSIYAMDNELIQPLLDAIPAA